MRLMHLPIVILFAFLIFSISASHAEIPQVLNYQGKVTDTGGVPVADGDYSMTFTIYDAEVSGTSLWSSGAMTVSVSGGVFSVLLGDTGQPALSLDFDEDYWVEVDIDGDVQSPRMRIGSGGYAYMASGLVPGTEINGSVTSGSNSGLKVTNTATTGYTYGILALSNSTLGRGLIGHAMGTTDACIGVIGRSFSSMGTGVYGAAMATSGENYGIHGETFSSTGYAGYFEGNTWITGNLTVEGTIINSGLGDITAVNAGTGLSGGGTTGDVSLEASVPFSLTGVNANAIIQGNNTNTTGWSPGVRGQTASTYGHAIEGIATATTGTATAGYFENFATGDESKCVFAWARGTTGDNWAGRFENKSSSGTGVFGFATASTGTTYGVEGVANETGGYGVFGMGNWGVYGVAPNPDSDDVGVYSSGDFVASGSKSCVVETSEGPTLMYCQESTENWFEDFGEGRLVDGHCRVELDPLFLEMITIDEQNPMHVFIQPKGRCYGTFVETGTTGFDVFEQEDGSSDTEFSYRVVAKRKGFESKRLEYCKAAETDSYLYPELRGRELRKLETMRIGIVGD